MIKQILESIASSLTDIQAYIKFPKFKKNLDLIGYIKSSVEADLTQLSLKDPTFLDGPDGNIDYYSPHVEQQLANQKQIIEKSLEQLTLLQAAIYTFYKYNNEGKSLQGKTVTATSPEGQRLLELKDATSSLLSVTSLALMANRPDIQESIQKIKEYNDLKQQLKNTELVLKKGNKTGQEKIELETKVADLTSKIKEFEKDDRPGFRTVSNELSDLNRKLLKHEKIKSQIPKGMQDMKRALSFVREIKSNQNILLKKQKELGPLAPDDPKVNPLKKEIADLELVIKTLNKTISFSDSEDSDKALKEMLDDVRKLMASSISGYQKLLASGGDINAYLHQTTGFYWENLFLYRKTLEAFNQKLKDTANLTAKGEELVLCVTEALSQVPEERVINKAISAVKQVDNNLSLRANKYNEKADDHQIKFYKGGAVSLTQTIMALEDKPFFFLPYNANNYVLDHPAHVDIIGALGNCYGETQMFLKRINSKTPSITNICPETELMNYQLDQTRRLSTSPETIGTFESTGPGSFAKWDTIKDIITKAPTSTKHGDVCYLRFSGAQVPGHDADVAHAMGFIKLTNPNPYKYVVYDYNLGAMGFSDEIQLEAFFKQIFEGDVAYYPYSKFVIQKVDEVTNECANFINGANGIQSLKKAAPNASCTRNYWDEPRIELLIKYFNGKSQDDLKLILDKIKLLPLVQQQQLSQKLIDNPNVNHAQLLNLAIKNNGVGVIEQLVKSDHIVSYNDKAELAKGIVAHMVNLLDQGQITPERACKVFPSNKVIFLAAFNKAPESIEFASTELVKAVYESSKDPNILKYATKNQILALIKATKNANTLLQAIAPAIIVELINESKFNAKELEQCCKAFNSHEEVMLAAFKKNPKTLNNASADLVVSFIEKDVITAEKACELFANNEKIISAAVQHKSAALRSVAVPMVVKLLDKQIISAEQVCTSFPNNDQLILEAYKRQPKVIGVLPFSGLVERLVKKGQITAQDALAAFPDQTALEKAADCGNQLAELNLLKVTGSHTQYAERAQKLGELNILRKAYPIPSVDQQITLLIKNLCDVYVEELKKQSAPPSKETIQSIKKFNGDKLIELMQELAKRNEQLQLQEIATVTELSEPIEVEERKLDTAQEAAQLIEAIRQLQIGMKDTFINQYCILKGNELERCRKNPQKLDQMLVSLKKIYEAANSPEMQAVRNALETLASEGKKTTLFGGHKADQSTTKIQRIQAAVYKVPLHERMNVFSNTHNEHCNRVKQTLLATLGVQEFSLKTLEQPPLSNAVNL